MKYLAAYLLLKLGGNEAPTAEEVTTLLTESGVDEVDAAKVQKVIADLNGQNLEELINAGMKKVGSLGGGGAAAAGSAGGAAAGGMCSISRNLILICFISCIVL